MEEITIEKIDTIRERFKLSYEEAKNVLEANNGNLIDSLVYLEKNSKDLGENELITKVKEIINKGNVNRIKIKKDNRVLIDIPVSAGVVTGALAIFYPSLIAIGAVAAILSGIKIEIERPDGSVEVIEDLFKREN